MLIGLVSTVIIVARMSIKFCPKKTEGKYPENLVITTAITTMLLIIS